MESQKPKASLSSSYLALRDDQGLCDTTKELLESEHFQRFLAIYNKHTAEIRAEQKSVLLEDVLRDRNIRNDMRLFFNKRIELRLTGAEAAAKVVTVTAIVDKAIEILDERNNKIASKEIHVDSYAAEQLLNRRFNIAA